MFTFSWMLISICHRDDQKGNASSKSSSSQCRNTFWDGVAVHIGQLEEDEVRQYGYHHDHRRACRDTCQWLAILAIIACKATCCDNNDTGVRSLMSTARNSCHHCMQGKVL